MEIKNTKIAVAGTGRFAYSFVHHLIKKGFIIHSVFGRTKKQAEEFADKFGIPFSGSFNGRVPAEVKTFFIALPDKEIKPAAVKMASSNKNLQGKIFIHFSGSFSSSLLESLKRKKALTGSFHIMQTFSSKKLAQIKNCYTAVETPDDTLRFALFNFAKELKLRPFQISPEKKIFYHLSGVFTSNFLFSHFYNSGNLFGMTGISNIGYIELFGRIIDETIKNIKSKGAENALAGPAARGDIDTIKNHIALLKKKKEYRLLVNYLNESLTIMDIIGEQGENKRECLLICKYLKKQLSDTLSKY